MDLLDTYGCPRLAGAVSARRTTAVFVLVASVVCCETNAAQGDSARAASGSPVKLRALAEGEISASRGEPEDQLRRDVLAAFWEEERVEQLHQILNSPWDTKGIMYLWSLVVAGHGEPGAEARVEIVQKERILKLLALCFGEYKGSEVRALIGELFDSLFVELSSEGPHGGQTPDSPETHKWAPYHRARLYAVVLNAIEQYGSPELFGSGFWRCFETYEDGFVGLRVLGKLGDAGALERLKEFQRACPWEEPRRQLMLKDTIRAMEKRLVAGGGSEQDARP